MSTSYQGSTTPRLRIVEDDAGLDAYESARVALLAQLVGDDVAVERLLLRAFRLGVQDGGVGRDFATGQEVAAVLTGFGLTPKLHTLLRNVYNAGSAWRRGTLLDASKRLR